MKQVVEVKKSQPRDGHGRFSDTDTPPLVNVTVSNPITYLKLWWQKVVANEGIDIKLRIHPLTALLGSILFALGGFGLGRISVPEPLTKYIPQFAPAPTPDPWRETAFTGFLRTSGTPSKYYLETQAAEAISLEVPTNVDLKKYIGRRIFATGKLNTKSGILVVSDAQDLELLPTQITHIPAVTPLSTPLN